MCGEVIATMTLECVRYEVDIVAGDGNKAAYYATPKSPGVPTYACSLLQFWIDRMINIATQARIKQYGRSPKVRANHFITCSYTDLVHLSHNLRGIATENYTDELAKKTEGYGDRCMLSVLEWAILAMTFLKMLLFTMMKTTWTMRENFFRWMRLVFTATRSLFSFHKMTEIFTIQCLFTSLHRKWLGMKQDNMFIGRRVVKEIKTEKQGKRITNASHPNKNRQDKVIGVAIHLQQHPQRHGGQGIDECRLLTIEDSTAEGRFHCIVFQLAADFIFISIHKFFPRRDDVIWYFHRSHIWYGLFSRREDTMCASNNFM